MFESSVTYRDVSLNLAAFKPFMDRQLNEEHMANDKEGKVSDSKPRESRKRLRDGRSQTDEEDLLASGRSTSARLDEMNAKLDIVLAACDESESPKKEIFELRELKSLKVIRIRRERDHQLKKRNGGNFHDS